MSLPGGGYFTFFLCGHDWSHGFGAFAPWVDRLLAAFSLGRRATVSAAAAPGSPLGRQSRSGRYEPQALSRWPADIVTVSVSKDAGRHRFFAFLEGSRYRHTPEYVRWLEPASPGMARDLDALRIASFSFDPELLTRAPTAAEVVRTIESMFLELGCVYAYGHTTSHVISSPYMLIQAGRRGRLRIADIDYRWCIEDVYVHNWLSAGHVDAIADLDAVLHLGPATARRLETDDGGFRGLYLGTQGAASGLVEELRRQFAGLLPSPPPRRRATLIVGAPEVARMGADALRRCFVSPVVTPRPGGYVEIDDLEALAQADPRAFEEALECVYRGTRAAAASARARESLIEFASPFDPQHLYYRFVRGTGDEDAAKIRTGRIAGRSAVPVRLITRQRADAESAAKVLERWASAVSAATDDCGGMEWRQSVGVGSSGTAHYAEGVVDASRLEEAAFSLLATLLDEANAGRCVVPYAVVGDGDLFPSV